MLWRLRVGVFQNSFLRSEWRDVALAFPKSLEVTASSLQWPTKINRGNEAGNCPLLMMHFFFQLWLVREVQWKIHIFCPPEIRTASESQESRLSARLKRLSKTPPRPETRNQTWWRCGRNLGDHLKTHSKNGWWKSCLDGSSSPKKLASHSKPRQVPQTGSWFSGSPAWTKTGEKIGGSCVWYPGSNFLLILRFKLRSKICKNMVSQNQQSLIHLDGFLKSGELTSWGKGSLSHYLQGFIHPRWLLGISEPSTNLELPWKVLWIDGEHVKLLLVGPNQHLTSEYGRHSIPNQWEISMVNSVNPDLQWTESHSMNPRAHPSDRLQSKIAEKKI